MLKKIAEEDEFLQYRSTYQPKLPKVLRASELQVHSKELDTPEEIKKLFPFLSKQGIKYVSFTEKESVAGEIKPALRIGVVLSGGQAPGGHNVISGPAGIYNGKYIELRDDAVNYFRNRGGFDIIHSGRNKIDTPEQFLNSQKHCQALKLDGLIIIGGDDSNTNACLLAEYFLANSCPTKVIGCPKTIDADLKNEFIEVSFGFDTACKTYSESIGNIMLDTVSSKKYYHFIRLMGRSASHITLECALLTRPTIALIGEEIEHNKKKLNDIVNEIADIIVARHEINKGYGVVLVAEGLIEFIKEINDLIKEINEIFSKSDEKLNEPEKLFELVCSKLTSEAQKLFLFFPRIIAEQLLIDRDPHGNAQIGKIDTEKLLVILLKTELENRRVAGKFHGKFSALTHFFGYEGRSAYPTLFDCDYCYSLGMNAAALVDNGSTGLMSIVRNLDKDPEEWMAGGCPLVPMMTVERRKGKDVPVIKKALVDLEGRLFKIYEKERVHWAMANHFQSPGPIQFEFNVRPPYIVKPPNGEELEYKENKLYKEQNRPFSRVYPTGNFSPLAYARTKSQPQLAAILQQDNYEVILSNHLNYTSAETKSLARGSYPALVKEFLTLLNINIVEKSSAKASTENIFKIQHKTLKIGVAFCGKEFPGAHNTLSGLMEFTNRIKSELVGFLGGIKGLIKGDIIKITPESLELYVNQGGFHYLGRTTDKFQTEQEIEEACNTCEKLSLDGLVLVGSSNAYTDAVRISNYLLSKGSRTRVITIPGTVEGDVGHQMLEANVGFDTASKHYSQLIGNIMKDSASAVKLWYFVRLMGKDTSHLIMEAGLQTQPNMVLVSEEIIQEGKDLNHLINDICDLICERAEQGKNYGTVLIPEGLMIHLPHCRALIEELNELFIQAKTKELRKELETDLLKNPDFVKKKLSSLAAAIFLSFPDFIKDQFVLDRESHGTLNLSRIETERLVPHLVSAELAKRKTEKKYKGSFGAMTHYFGYQGRCAIPSIFDANLAHNYGFIAGVFIQHGLTGCSVTARGLVNDVKDWQLGAIPLLAMLETRTKSLHGENKAIIPPYEVNLKKKYRLDASCYKYNTIYSPFLELKKRRDDWRTNEVFINPGPIQLFGRMANKITKTLALTTQSYPSALKKIEELVESIKNRCKSKVNENTLKLAIMNLQNLENMLDLFTENNLE